MLKEIGFMSEKLQSLLCCSHEDNEQFPHLLCSSKIE